MLKKFISHLNRDSDAAPSNSLYSPFPKALVTLTAIFKGAFVMTPIAVVDTRRFLMHLVAAITFKLLLVASFHARVGVVGVNLFVVNGVAFRPLDNLFITRVLIGHMAVEAGIT